MKSIDKIDQYKDHFVEIVIEYGPKFVGGIVLLIVGLWFIKILATAIGKIMVKRNVNPSLTTFLRSFISGLLKVLLAIAVMDMIGIAMTSFIAILGAAGLAIGMALSGTLKNFAGGVVLLLLKPFKVGDFIESQGFSGTVTEIEIFHTILKTPDNKTIIIPNGPLSTGSVINYSTESTRRIDFTFSIGYGDDIDKARNVLQSLIDKEERILKEPEPQIVVSELADSSVNFAVKTWVNSVDYWPVKYLMTENVKKTFDQENISIPFPQRDIHVYNN